MPKDGHHLSGNIDNIALPIHTPPNTESLIVAEIAARLIEWRSTHIVFIESKPFNWLQRIARLGRDNPDALWLYLHLQSGDLSALTNTYQSQALERSTSRQAIEQRLDRSLQAMSLHFPELQHTIAELRHAFHPHRGINTSTHTNLTGPL